MPPLPRTPECLACDESARPGAEVRRSKPPPLPRRSRPLPEASARQQEQGPRNAAGPRAGPAVASVPVLLERRSSSAASRWPSPTMRLDRVGYGLDHLQAAPGLRARYVLERSPRLCGSSSDSSREPIPQRFIAARCCQWIAFAQAMPWAARSRASWTRPRRVASAALRCTSSASGQRSMRTPASAYYLGVLDVPLRELPAAGVPLDVGEIPRQPVTVGRCALLQEARQLRLVRVASRHSGRRRRRRRRPVSSPTGGYQPGRSCSFASAVARVTTSGSGRPARSRSATIRSAAGPSEPSPASSLAVTA